MIQVKKLKKLEGFAQIVQEGELPTEEATTKDKKWVQDPAGYVLIKLNFEEKIIRVGFCTPENKLVKEVFGKDVEELYHKCIKEGFVSRLDHAAYLGMELEKAFVALRTGQEYVQCDQLKF